MFPTKYDNAENATRRLISDGYAADEILHAKNEVEARGRVKMHILASPSKVRQNS